MATSTCSQCNSSYPSMLKACPACKSEAPSRTAAPSDIKKFVPLIVAVDVLLIGGFLFYFFVLR